MPAAEQPRSSVPYHLLARLRPFAMPRALSCEEAPQAGRRGRLQMMHQERRHTVELCTGQQSGGSLRVLPERGLRSHVHGLHLRGQPQGVPGAVPQRMAPGRRLKAARHRLHMLGRRA